MPNLPRLANGMPTSADLNIEFMERIDDALSRIESNPQMYPIVYRTLRRAVVRHFPFAVFYEVTADEIQVVAVFHSS
jgi:plasmid stabilization system protein ParE